MNINTISTASESVKPVLTEPVMPASEPTKIDGANKNNSRISVSVDNYRPAEAKGKQENYLSAEAAEQLISEMNEIMDNLNLKTRLGFSMRENHKHQVIVEIKNRDTDELIKQIPSEELLSIKEKIEEFTGLIFDQRV